MPESYYYKTSGQTFGPVSLAVLSQMVRQQVLVAGDLCREAHGDWKDVEVAALGPALLDRLGTEPACGSAMRSPPSSRRNTERPWVYLTRLGVHGPLTTGLFLEAVQRGLVEKRTLVRLHPGPDWFAAELIEGLVFPASEEFPDVITHDSILRGSVSRTGIQRPPSCPQMRQLVVECLSQQRTNGSLPVDREPGATLAEIGRRWSGPIHAMGSLVVSFFAGTLAIGGRWVRSRIVWGLVVVVCVACVSIRVAPNLVTTEQVYARLQETYEELVHLKRQPDDVAAKKAFRARVHRELEALVPVLERRARTDDKASMSLLWLARDYLPQTLNAFPSPDASKERLVQEHLGIVQLQLRYSNRSSHTADWWMWSIVGVDVIGVLGAFMFFVRKRFVG